MNLTKALKKHLIRLKNSSKILRLNFYYHKLFNEKNLGSIGLNFDNKPTRNEIIQEIINIKKYINYLEIGCFDDDLFSNVICQNKVGVDPVSGGNIRKTSDDFFKSNKEKFDIIFIDGLHIYAQVKKDIINSLNCLKDDGIILLHDCLPNNIYAQAVPRCQDIWNGDVWKAIIECRTKDDIDTYTCYADHGIGIIFKRKNKNLLKLETSNFSSLKFNDYYKNHKEYMNIIEFDDLKKII